MLAAANGAVLRAATRQEILQGVCDVAVQDPEIVLAWVGERREEGSLVPLAAAGLGAERVAETTISLDSPLPSARAIAEGRPCVVHDIAAATPYDVHRRGVVAGGLASSCCLPISVHDTIVGSLALYGSRVGMFDDGLVELFEQLAADVAFALQALADREAQAEARQRAVQSEAQLQAVLSLGRDVVSVLDREGRALWITDSVESITGFPPEHYLGEDLADDVHPDDLDLTLEAWTAVQGEPGATSSAEMRLRHRDGGWRWMEVYLTNRTDHLGPDGVLSNMHDITESRAARDAMRFQAELLSSVGEVVIATDREARVTYWNSAAERLFGWSAREAIGRLAGDVAPVVEGAQHIDAATAAMRERRPWTDEIVVETRHGAQVPLSIHNTPIVDDHGRVAGFIGVSSDITEKVAARRDLERQATMQAEIARVGQLALAEGDVDAVIDVVTESLARTAGVDIAMFVELAHRQTGEATAHGAVVRAQFGALTARKGEPLTEAQAGLLEAFLPRIEREPILTGLARDPRYRTWMEQLVLPVEAVVAVPVRRRGADHGVLAGFALGDRSFGEDEANFVVALGNIVSARLDQAETEGELRRLALHDGLTGLPNRTLLVDRIEHAAAAAQRDGATLAVLVIDLDGFKLVNDALGHHVGDQLLVVVAERLVDAVRAGDTVARLGGDEFAVLCEGVHDVTEAAMVAERVAEAMATPIAIDGVETYVTASIGITARTGEEASADVLLREADGAMYRAKEQGRSRHEIFDTQMRDRAIERFDLTNDLRRALPRDEFRLVWQPEVALARADGTEGVWVEALLRWEHPEHGLLAPARFIDVAESTGLINPIGEWALAQACREFCAWQESGRSAPSMVSVNLSARQLAQPDLVDRVKAVVAETGIDPTRLMLEITETAVMGDPVTSIARLGALRDLGLQIAIDDFGTGYSSLTYLRRLPVDCLKIDLTFVSGLTDSLRDRAIVEGIIALAHAVDLFTIAEGVESEAQAAELVELGCDWGQGYLWSRPVDGATLLDWIEAEAR
nr:EAL domain-containing protein [Rhabdothermincola salaria]